MVPNSSTARANIRSQLVSLKFMMPRSGSRPRERNCFLSPERMERAYLYIRLRDSNPDNGAANALLRPWSEWSSPFPLGLGNNWF
jgi:hypothetical protein